MQVNRSRACPVETALCMSECELRNLKCSEHTIAWAERLLYEIFQGEGKDRFARYSQGKRIMQSHKKYDCLVHYSLAQANFEVNLILASLIQCTQELMFSHKLCKLCILSVFRAALRPRKKIELFLAEKDPGDGREFIICLWIILIISL